MASTKLELKVGSSSWTDFQFLKNYSFSGKIFFLLHLVQDHRLKKGQETRRSFGISRHLRWWSRFGSNRNLYKWLCTVTLVLDGWEDSRTLFYCTSCCKYQIGLLNFLEMVNKNYEFLIWSKVFTKLKEWTLVLISSFW